MIHNEKLIRPYKILYTTKLYHKGILQTSLFSKDKIKIQRSKYLRPYFQLFPSTIIDLKDYYQSFTIISGFDKFADFKYFLILKFYFKGYEIKKYVFLIENVN